MLVQDVKPPIQRAIQVTAEKTAKYYKRFRFVIKTSKYSAPIIVLLLSVIIVGTVAGFQNNTKKLVLVPSTFDGDWNGMQNLRVLTLKDSADEYDFNSANSAYTNLEELRYIPPASDLPIEDVTTETNQGENVSSTTSTTEENATTSEANEQATSSEDLNQEENNPPSSTPAEVIVPAETTTTQEVVPPAEEPPAPQEEQTGTSTSFFQKLFGRLTAKAQDTTDSPAETTPPQEPQNVQPEAPVENNSQEEPQPTEEVPQEPTTTEEIILPTIDATGTATETDEGAVTTDEVATSTPTSTNEDFFKEKPTKKDDVTVFTQTRQMTISDFVPQYLPQSIESLESLRLNVSMGAEKKAVKSDELIFEYRFSEEDPWSEIESLPLDESRSNVANRGYYSFDISLPETIDLAGVRHMQVRVTSISNEPKGQDASAFIDAIWTELSYKTGDVIPVDEKPDYTKVSGKLVAVSDNFDPERVYNDASFDSAKSNNNCSAEPNSRDINRGESTSFKITAKPNGDYEDFGVRLGNFPNGVGAYFEKIKKTEDGVWEANLMVNSREFAQQGSFGIPMLVFSSGGSASLCVISLQIN